jgi:hypothetical protein
MQDFSKALAGLTRRPTEVEGNTLVAYFTSQRRLELTRETDGVMSAWAVAPIVMSGQLVEVAVYVGDVTASGDVSRIMRAAKAIIAEVINSGSRTGAAVLGEGVLSRATVTVENFDGTAAEKGTKVFAYSAPGVDPILAGQRFDSFVGRHGVQLVGSGAKSSRKSARSKATAA